MNAFDLVSRENRLFVLEERVAECEQAVIVAARFVAKDQSGDISLRIRLKLAIDRLDAAEKVLGDAR